jgi:hypothetical protein
MMNGLTNLETPTSQESRIPQILRVAHEKRMFQLRANYTIWHRRGDRGHRTSRPGPLPRGSCAGSMEAEHSIEKPEQPQRNDLPKTDFPIIPHHKGIRIVFEPTLVFALSPDFKEIHPVHQQVSLSRDANMHPRTLYLMRKKGLSHSTRLLF